MALANTTLAAAVRHDSAGTIVSSDDTELRFNEIEWSAFLAGIRNGEFNFDFQASELN